MQRALAAYRKCDDIGDHQANCGFWYTFDYECKPKETPPCEPKPVT